MTYPRIYLAVDNCFSSKRWTAPEDWASTIRDLGLVYVEASADVECDPLYGTPAYLVEWASRVEAAEEASGIQVANLYSGHGTYATLGLTHTDRRIRERMHHQWLEPMIDLAAGLKAGLGFFCHAFPQAVLEDPSRYYEARAELLDRLASLASYAAEAGVGYVGLEQMYTPHQVPWTLDGAESLIRQVYADSGRPFYLTVDVGHASGQRRFLRPDAEAVRGAVEAMRRGEEPSGLWLGPHAAYSLLGEAVADASFDLDALMDGLESRWQDCPYLFATHPDGDPYAWLERLGAYSPIIHLQQTTGQVSAHRPFTLEWNRTGIIHGDQVLRAIARSYDRPIAEDLPPRCETLYLTLEVFARTADIPVDLLATLRESVEYWRQFVPVDGMPLDQVLSQL